MSQSMHITWWTLFSTLHTLSNSSSWIIRSARCLSCCCILFRFSILGVVCACVDCTTYVCTHRERWACKLFRPWWLDLILSWGFPNHRCIILLHPCQSSKLPRCMPHHHAGIVHSAHFRASNCCCYGTMPSNVFRYSSTTINPSYVNRSLASIVTQRSELTIMLQLSIVTSCNRFFHHFISSSKSEVQELSRSHNILPSTVGFT